MSRTETDRDAAAVLLVRGAGQALEVFLVERAPELRFFGGYLALPGGVRGDEDVQAAGGDGARALEFCALRELFEETGVLLAGARALTQEDRRSLRTGLLAGTPAALREFHERAGSASARGALRDVCRIRTPAFAPVRYDTVFALAQLPQGELPEVVPGELVGGRFVQPREALAAWRRGEARIVPPVVILLQLLLAGDLEQFVAHARALADGYHAGKLHRVQFSPGVILASLRTPTLPPATTTNCLVLGEERLFVVDPGTPHRDEQERLFTLLDELRTEGRSLQAVLLTHHHEDHVGAVHATSRRYGIPVRGHPLTLERLAPGAILGAPIEDGDELELGTAPDGSSSWRLRAVFTPGHDRGHLCYRESRYSAVCVGDMLSTVSSIVIDPPEGHMATYLASLARLLAEPMATLYPAHGPAVPDGHRLVRQYLRHREQRESHLLEALGKGPATLEQLLPLVYWDVDPRMLPIARRSLLAGVEKLREEGRVRERDGVWCLD